MVNVISWNNFHPISEHLDPQDIMQFSQTCRAANDFINKSKLWEVIAKKIHCPVESNDDSSTIKKNINNIVLNLKQTIKGYPKQEIPQDIQEVLNKLGCPTLKEINLLRQYCKARDVIVFWKKIARKTNSNSDLPEAVFNSSETVINESKNFKNWLDKNKDNFTKLRSLFLKDQRLTYLPPEIGALTQLQKLNLDNNQLVELPSEIGTLSQLETLSLNNNQLMNLPPEINSLHQLRHIGLDGNPLNRAAGGGACCP